MNGHPVGELMNITLEKIHGMVDSNTVVGEAVYSKDGTTILPVSKVSVGFGVGGSDFPTKVPKNMFGGGGGAGVTVTPVGFLVIQSNGNVKMIQLADNKNAIDRAVGMAPEMVDKITGLFNKKKDTQDQPTSATTEGETT